MWLRPCGSGVVRRGRDLSGGTALDLFVVYEDDDDE